MTAWRRYRDWTESGVWSHVWRVLCESWTDSERDHWEMQFERNPRARSTGAIAGQEMWVDASDSELAIDLAVDAYEADAGFSAVMLSNGGLEADWGL